MNKKRLVIYGGLAVMGVLLVLWKQQDVTRERSQKVVSTISQWDEKGKPVEVWQAVRRDVPVYTKVTARQIDARTFEGYVSREVRDKVAVGQDMLFSVDGLQVTGTISTIAEDISLETGLYPVRTTFSRPFELKSWVAAYAHIDTLRNVICVPNEIIDKEGETFFVWTAVDGQAAAMEGRGLGEMDCPCQD